MGSHLLHLKFFLTLNGEKYASLPLLNCGRARACACVCVDPLKSLSVIYHLCRTVDDN